MFFREEIEMVIGHIRKAAASLGIVAGPQVSDGRGNMVKRALVACDGIDPGDSVLIALRAKHSLIDSGKYAYGIWYDKALNKIVIGTRKEEFDRECENRDQ